MCCRHTPQCLQVEFRLCSKAFPFLLHLNLCVYATVWFLKSPKKILAIKFWRFSVLGMGVWGEPGFVVRRPSSVVVSGKSRVCVKNQAESRKKIELQAPKRPTTAGAACRRAQRPATPPAHAQGPRRQLPNMA